MSRVTNPGACPPPLYVITIERRRWKTGICFVHRRTLCSPLSGYLTDLLSRAYWGAIGRFDGLLCTQSNPPPLVPQSSVTLCWWTLPKYQDPGDVIPGQVSQYITRVQGFGYEGPGLRPLSGRWDILGERQRTEAPKTILGIK